MANPLAKNSKNQKLFDLKKGDKALQNLVKKFGKIKSSHPVDSYVNVLLLGNSGVVKVHLLKSLLKELPALLGLVSLDMSKV